VVLLCIIRSSSRVLIEKLIFTQLIMPFLWIAKAHYHIHETCYQFLTLKMETVCFSEILVYVYKSTWHQNPEEH
jgi:hypothetical protein